MIGPVKQMAGDMHLSGRLFFSCQGFSPDRCSPGRGRPADDGNGRAWRKTGGRAEGDKLQMTMSLLTTKSSPPSGTRIPACCANANMPGDAHAGKFQVQGAGRKAIPCRFLSLVIPAHLGPVAACCLPSGRRPYWYCVPGPVAARLAGARADPSTPPRSRLLDLPQQYPGVCCRPWNPGTATSPHLRLHLLFLAHARHTHNAATSTSYATTRCTQSPSPASSRRASGTWYLAHSTQRRASAPHAPG
jgi:hypothetical protein